MQVGDAKRKRTAANLDDKKRSVAQSDVHQMTAYGRLYVCPGLTLPYRHHAGPGANDGLSASQIIAGSQRHLETVTVHITTAAGIGWTLGPGSWNRHLISDQCCSPFAKRNSTRRLRASPGSRPVSGYESPNPATTTRRAASRSLWPTSSLRASLARAADSVKLSS